MSHCTCRPGSGAEHAQRPARHRACGACASGARACGAYDGGVSTPSSPSGGDSPLEHLLGDLLNLIGKSSPSQWELARQLGQAVATGGEAEPNVDPGERIRLEELGQVAELHVSHVTGIATAPGNGRALVVPATRSEWAARALHDWSRFLELLAGSLATPPGGAGGPGTAGPEALPGLAGLIGSLGQVMGPALLGMQIGSSVGHLARRAFGQYPIPVPRPPTGEVLLVPENIRSFADDWSLPPDEVRLWTCISEITHHTILSRPTVSSELSLLVESYAKGFEIDQQDVEKRLAEIDPLDFESFEAAIGSPTTFMGEMTSPGQRETLARIGAAAAAIEGYVDYVLDRAGQPLIHTYPALSEALRRRRVERDEGERLVERLLGVELDQGLFDRGSRFTQGVLDRAGDEALVKMWVSPGALPTPAEIEAPGLWLARTELAEGR